ncbi:hypothetical protein [Metabacillus sp. RGM 3146]|uniref:hypothetical protein n=1 Tax=Metabacillus sp. RGM 3146 TaxID=3401092 RepID=UPI003B9C1BB3
MTVRINITFMFIHLEPVLAADEFEKNTSEMNTASFTMYNKDILIINSYPGEEKTEKDPSMERIQETLEPPESFLPYTTRNVFIFMSEKLLAFREKG